MTDRIPQLPTDVADRVRSSLASYPDFPSLGILFRDLTPVITDAALFGAVVDALRAPVPEGALIAGVEARGFVLAAAVAAVGASGMLAIRKAGKLPGTVLAEAYDLEYGSASLELHPSAEDVGGPVYLLDDVLATGGTLAAAATLLERCGYTIAGIGVVLELGDLGGRRMLTGYDVRSVLTL